MLHLPGPTGQQAVAKLIARKYQSFSVVFKEPNTVEVAVITRDNPELFVRSYPLT